MDRCGRKTNCILTMFVMGIGFLVMYLSVDFPSLLASGIIIGLGNGLSTGLIMAISGDYAPKDQRRGPFLSLFKLIYGLGQMFGPSMTGIASEYFGVEGGALLTVIVCVFGIIWGLEMKKFISILSVVMLFSAQTAFAQTSGSAASGSSAAGGTAGASAGAAAGGAAAGVAGGLAGLGIAGIAVAVAAVAVVAVAAADDNKAASSSTTTTTTT
jgi:MFS family permease